MPDRSNWAPVRALVRDLLVWADERDCRALETLGDQLASAPVGILVDDLVRGAIPIAPIELAGLIKLFVRCENCSKRRAGSTTRIPDLLNALRRLDPALGEELLVWAFHEARNLYVPFGTLNKDRLAATSVMDYRERRARHTAQLAAQEESRRAAAEERKQRRARAHQERLRGHAQAASSRDEVLNAFSDAGPTARLEAVARDPTHPPYWYPEAWAAVDESTIAGLDAEIATLLCRRLQRAPRGPWRQLARKLAAHVKN